MRRFWPGTLSILLALLTTIALAPQTTARAQESVYPLPADLYILTSDQRLIRIDATTGGQTVVAPEGQPIASFDVAPGGGWYAYRTTSNDAVIISALSDLGGYVVAFDEPLPGADPIRQAVAWSPKAQRLAYTVPEGLRIAQLTAYDTPDAMTSTIQGGPWVDVYWVDEHTVIVTDSAGTITRIGGSAGDWTVETAQDAPPRPLAVEARLTPEGVQLIDGRIVPGTAGAQAFDWGVAALPDAPASALPAALYFVAATEGGIVQVWQVPQGGGDAVQVTASDQPVIDYSVVSGRIAYATMNALFVAALGADAAPQQIATLTGEQTWPSVALSPDGAQVAFGDQRGLWLVPADGSAAPRQLVQNVYSEQDISGFRVYTTPRWNDAGTQLLVTVGLYEGSYLGVVDVASGDVTELPHAVASYGAWADDGRVANYSASFGYQTPGLYLLDPAAPEAEPVTLLGERSPVFDALQTADGTWAAAVGTTANMGPQFIHILTGRAEGDFSPAYGEDAGAFVQQPKLAPAAAQAGAPAIVAGLQSVTYGREGAQGDLIVADLSTGDVWQIATPGPARTLRWGG